MRIYSPTTRHKRQRRGTIIAFFLVIVGLLVTGLITSVAVSSVTGTQTASLTLKRDRAFYAAESGVQHAIWKVRYNSWAADNFPAFSGTAGGASYDVSVFENNGLGTVILKSVGKIANPAAPISVTVYATLSGCGYPMPTVAFGDGFSSSGTTRVAGNMMGLKDVKQTGGGKFSVGGNVYAGKTITGISVDPGYVYYQNSNFPLDENGKAEFLPNVKDIARSLKNTPGAFKLGTNVKASGFKLDFTQSPSKILYYEGSEIEDWDDPPVVGDGTLVIFASTSFKKARTFSGHKVNLVIDGDLHAKSGGQFFLQGSLYVSGSIKSQSSFTMQGVIVCGKDISVSGSADISQYPPPDFDPRIQALSGEEVTLGAFTGPIF